MHTYVDQFQEELSIRNYSPKSIVHHTHGIERFLRWLGKYGLDLRDVTKNDLLDYHEHLLSKEYKKSSIQSFMHSVKRFFTFLEDRCVIFMNPAEGIVLRRVHPGIPAVLSCKETLRLLEQPDMATPTGIRDRAILEVFYATGIRLNELFALDLDDVDLNNEILRVREAKFQKERMVPLTTAACECLDVYLKKVRPDYTGPKAEKALFVGEKGRRYNKLLIGRMVRQYAEEAGINKHVTPHLLRHTCATHLIERNVDICVIQQLLGHSRVSITQRYTHVNSGKINREHKKHPREKDDH
ncbi:MAG: tyrosine-type recombinase/integrase [Candidatus Omnitrophica bacterium]|nr:tyrosine-type recombinase/integrase [Candidatus Omnitrophota bacterium]